MYISLSQSFCLFLGRRTKLNLSVSVPLAGQALEPQLEEHMFRQIHLPCHNAQRYAEILQTGVVSQLQGRPKLIDRDMDMCRGLGGIGGGSAACSFASLQSARDKTQRKVKLALQIFCRQTNLRGGARGEL